MPRSFFAFTRGLRLRCSMFAALCAMASVLPAAEPADELRDQALAALRRAVRFMAEEASTEGGYLYRYTADLELREGEGAATDHQVWVQPPGTPAVGMALLRAYQATGDDYYLQAARRAGEALIRGQLRSGGWAPSIEFDAEKRGEHAYRVDPPGGRPERQRNMTSLDDNKTQSALRLLMSLDRELDFRDERLHEATRYALDRLVESQYPSGAFPQQFSGPPDAARFPVLEARYPDNWSRTWPDEDYREYYTFNDNAMADAIEVLVEAARTYDEQRYLDAALHCGDFMLRAQMPEPQPAWAQQYNRQMRPAWARKFEPPAVTGGESQGVIEVLLFLYRETGERRFLEPIPRALAYLKRSELPEGGLARFYELRTNRPLYFTKDYRLTYDDSDMPTHYAFKVGNRLERLAESYERALRSRPTPSDPFARAERPGPPSSGLVREVRALIETLDERGRWVEDSGLRYVDDPRGRPVVTTQTFVENVNTLAEFIAASGHD